MNYKQKGQFWNITLGFFSLRLSSVNDTSCLLLAVYSIASIKTYLAVVSNYGNGVWDIIFTIVFCYALSC